MMTYHPSILSKALLYQPLFLSIAQLKTSIRNERRSSGFPKAKLPLDRHYTTSMNETYKEYQRDILMILQCLWHVLYNIPLKIKKEQLFILRDLTIIKPQRTKGELKIKGIINTKVIMIIPKTISDIRIQRQRRKLNILYRICNPKHKSGNSHGISCK